MLYLPGRPRDECDDSAPCGGNMNEAADTLILFVVGTPLLGVHALCRGYGCMRPVIKDGKAVAARCGGWR